MAVTFFNPGNRIYEKMAFDHPTNDIKQVNLIAYHQIDAAEHDFFEVPTEITVNTEQGEFPVSVKFADRIQSAYKDYGVVRVNPKAKDIHEDDNVANTREEAKKKGDRLWREFLMAKAREHIANVETARASNVAPAFAKGVYAHALKVLGMKDPADPVGNIVESNQHTVDMDTVQAQMAELQRQIAALTKGK